MSKQAFDARIAAIEALRASGPDAAVTLQNALRDRNNFLVAKAAAVVADLSMAELSPYLIGAFERFLHDAAKTDPQCWAKIAIAKALKDLAHTDREIFLKGLKHIQLEPVWGGKADSAAMLRGTCALALIDCRLDDLTLLNHLAEALADAEKAVRVDAVIALSRSGVPEAAALLRFKALVGDSDAEVIGQCFFALMQMAPQDGAVFVERFLFSGREDDVLAEAASALSQSHQPSAVEALKRLWRTRLSPELRKALLAFLAASPQRSAAEFLFELGSAEAAKSLESSRFRDEFKLH